MNWKGFFKAILRIATISIALGVVILGLIGFLLAGRQGLINGMIWGLVLGLVSVPFSLMTFGPKYWGGYAKRYGEWYVNKETTNEE
jgi:hypothetical protein